MSSRRHATAEVLCLEIGCPNQPEPGRVRCAACNSDTTRGPLYARPHRVMDGGNGKCEVCGREDYDGIHLETAGPHQAGVTVTPGTHRTANEPG